SMDAIQFPRMLAAINDVDLTQQQVEQLCEAMDFEPHHLAEIFSRAQERWKAIEGDTRTGHTSVPRVIITVTGGVADVLCKPKGLTVSICDYDVGGGDLHDPRISKDPDGQACCIRLWPAVDEVADNGHWPIVEEAIDGTAQLYTRRWKCPGCGRTVDCSYESLAEVGSPFCADCEQEMTLL
ncbi:MAG: hypothetical protein NT031_05700, partial [Planctomycetota bacterium]|nr:hypothetical protein [Planctomycetota bacterium]